MFRKDNASIGAIGEQAARTFYEKRGFTILDVNYRKPYGEIDFVAKKRETLYFVEVKSVSCRTFTNVSQETFNPAENMHQRKRERLKRVIQAYLSARSYDGEWQSDLAVVYVNTVSRRSRVCVLEDVIL